MDKLELIANRGMQKYFVDLALPCPAHDKTGATCSGFLTEFDQEGWEPFKAFLLCPVCESRLRIWKKEMV